MTSREELFKEAKKAETEERWLDAFDSMKKLIVESLSAAESSSSSSSSALPTVAERGLFALAADKAFEKRRLEWEALRSAGDDDLVFEARIKLAEAMETAAKVVEAVSAEVVGILDLQLIKAAEVVRSVADIVFYQKMKAEFFRHVIEFKIAECRVAEARNDSDAVMYADALIKQLADQARSAYGLACSLANDTLSPAHPLRIQLALSVGIFLQRVFTNPDAAYDTLNQAFQEGLEALQEVDAIDPEAYREAASELKKLTKFMKELEGKDEADGLAEKMKETEVKEKEVKEKEEEEETKKEEEAG